jgi:Ulp1 family protease
LQAEATAKKKPLDLDEWTDYSLDSCPRQENFSDCGVFALQFMAHLSQGLPFQFSQQDMPNFRLRMAFEILKNQLLEH